MHILSFDIEEWFHILDHESTKTEKEWSKYEYRLDENLDRILQFLSDNDQKATFFVLGWIARHFPKQIARISQMGMEVASHSDMHQLVYEQTPEEFKADLDRSIKTLEDVTSQKIRAYRAPGFSVKEGSIWVFDILHELGIEVDSSIFPANRAHGGFQSFGKATPSIIERNGIRIKEFPMSTFKFFGNPIVFSGGGYFRVFPYSFIRHFMKSSDYTMTYFHPRDFDKDQPVIQDLSMVRKFKSYSGLSSSFRKLERFVNEHEFTDLIEAEKQINWSEVPVIKL
jgi:polysaccharide deacetylase family protein (PEP-CTERM system associated)